MPPKTARATFQVPKKIVLLLVAMPLLLVASSSSSNALVTSSDALVTSSICRFPFEFASNPETTTTVIVFLQK